jgi:hypothetical protein
LLLLPLLFIRRSLLFGLLGKKSMMTLYIYAVSFFFFFFVVVLREKRESEKEINQNSGRLVTFALRLTYFLSDSASCLILAASERKDVFWLNTSDRE